MGRTPFPSKGFAVEHLDDDLNVWMCGSCGGARSWRAARTVGGGERASERGSARVWERRWGRGVTVHFCDILSL